MALALVSASSQYVDWGSPAGLDDIAPMTQMAWLNLDSYGGGGFGRLFDKTQNISFVSNTAPANAASLSFIQNASTGNGFWCTPINSLSLSVWHHVVITYDNSVLGTPVMYIDGVSQTITTITGASGTRTSDAAANLFMGNWSSGVGRELDGRIEDARIYNRILSANEILNIYSSRGHDFILSSLVLRALCCDKGEATAAASGDPVDLSNNKFASTLTGTPNYAASHLTWKSRRTI